MCTMEALTSVYSFWSLFNPSVSICDDYWVLKYYMTKHTISSMLHVIHRAYLTIKMTLTKLNSPSDSHNTDSIFNINFLSSRTEVFSSLGWLTASSSHPVARSSSSFFVSSLDWQTVSPCLWPSPAGAKDPPPHKKVSTM